MLTVEVKINGRVVALASLRNVSDLSTVSNYEGRVSEAPCPTTGVEGFDRAVEVNQHDREQSVWALVAALADAGQRAQDEVGGAAFKRRGSTYLVPASAKP